jgi:hypothetical protein
MEAPKLDKWTTLNIIGLARAQAHRERLHQIAGDFLKTHPIMPIAEAIKKLQERGSTPLYLAYCENTQDTYLAQPADLVSCCSCDFSEYFPYRLPYSPVCPACGEDNTVLVGVLCADIPPWL